MTLIVNQFADKSLDIAPAQFSNIARFIAGVPSHTKHVQNTRTLNFCYGGRSHVIFYTITNIERGETLYIDYN